MDTAGRYSLKTRIELAMTYQAGLGRPGGAPLCITDQMLVLLPRFLLQRLQGFLAAMQR